jgi:hypothetical protein
MSFDHETIVLDPHGDLYLLLERPNETCGSDSAAHVVSIPDASSEDSTVDIVPGPSIDTFDESVTVHVSSDGRPPANNARGDEHFDKELERGPCEGGHRQIHSTKHKVEMRVSWKHLSLASSIFAKESPRTDSKDDRTIPLLEDDFGAMEMILNIIHGRTRKVSRQVDVPALKQIVGLIDKYEFHEAVEIFTDMWFDSLRPTILDGERQQLVS